MRMKRRMTLILMAIGVALLAAAGFAAEPLSPQDVWNLKTCGSAQISPDGKWILYTVSSQRAAEDEPGGNYSELYLVSTQTGQVRPFITDKVNISSPQWTKDGSRIGFLATRNGQKSAQVWMIPMSGGEAVQATHSETSVQFFRFHPDGKSVAFIAETPQSKRERELKDKGYDFVYYEENLKHRNLYMACLDCGEGTCKGKQLTEDVTVWTFEFDPSGKKIAAAISPLNLVDHQYMFKKIFLIDLDTKERTQISDNPGKLGNFEFSPDGSRLAYAAARELKDHAVSQVYVIDLAAKTTKNLTLPNFRGHVEWVGWKDKNTILYKSGEGVWPTLSLVPAVGGERKVILHANDSGVAFGEPSFTSDFKHFALTGSTTDSPEEVYFWDGKKSFRKMTDVNPWLKDRKLGKQELIRYTARDGQEIEGLLMLPPDYAGEKLPLVLLIHGGPESHHSNGWLTRYSEPGQVLAGKGYAALYLNYRASTGYGLEFALKGYEDPAGVEFDDIADAIKHLIDTGIADPDRVGLGGGSYGGYAAAWFSSYYTKLVKAVCMFVGISDITSKRGTTDIPYEEMYVHSGKKLEESWDFALKRSPIFYAHQSRTAVLILGGTNDTRVHPSQSMEYYRQLKMNGHPAVRLVQYPGEGHGNRKQPGKIDLLLRILDWYDWYVRDEKPLDGPMPPLDISDRYGLDLK